MSAQAIQERNSVKLFRAEHPIALDRSVVAKNGTLFVPIRDITEAFDYHLSFSRKFHHYELEFGSDKLYLAPNVQGYQRNGTKGNFRNAPFMHNGRFYVPLVEGMALLNIKTETKGQSIYLIENRQVQHTKLVSAKPKATPIKTVEANTAPKPATKHQTLFHSTAIKDPAKASIHHQFSSIYVLNHSYRSQDILKTFQGRRYVNFRPIFLDNGYLVTHTDTGFTLKKNGQQYVFDTRKQRLTLVSNEGKTKTKVPVAYRFTRRGDQLLFTEGPFLEQLGLVPYNDFKNKRSVLLTKVKSISIEKESGQYKLKVDASHPVTVAGPFILKKPLRLYWDLPYTSFDSRDLYQRLNDSGLLQVTIGKHPQKTRIVLHLGQSMTASTDIQENLAQIILKPGKLQKPAPKKQAYVASTKTQRRKEPTLKGKVIAIDPGHGGFDPGAIGIYNEKEKIYTLDISLRLKRELEKRGARVVIARTNDKNPSLGTRTRMANRHKADAFLSIHINSFVKSYARGTETYYYKQSDKPLSREIQKALVGTLKLKDNGIKRSSMYVLKHSTMPAALIEPCFITNPTENYLIKQASFRQNIANGIVIGLEQYFKKHRG